MAVLFLLCVAIGLLAVLAKIIVALAHVLCWLMKYIILPLGLLWCISYIMKYGV